MRFSTWILILTVLPSTVGAAEGKKPSAVVRRSAPSAGSTRSDPRVDAFAGFSHAKSGDATLNGWELSASFPFRNRLRLAVDLARESGSFGGADLQETSLLAGPALAWRHDRLRPFARLLVGAVRHGREVVGLRESSTHLGLALAGGTDYVFSKSWAARGQAGLWFVRGGGATDANLHLAIGAVYRFKP
jgi:hypothetical protein